MNKNKEIQCVILAGGRGTRLDGKGKYSQILFNKTLLEHVIDRLSTQTSNIAINFNKDKPEIRKKHMIILDKYNNVGPLAGIHSAISFCIDNIKIKEGLVVTVPVDTPFIPNDLISRFEKEIERSKSNIVVACSGDRHHPTIAMWKTSVIEKLENSIKNNVRKIDLFTKELKKSYINYSIKKYDPFYNINDYRDLKYAENMIKKNIVS